MVSRSTDRNTRVNAFEEGYRAFLSGVLDNPYQSDTKQGRDWELGFNKAYFKNKELSSGRATKEENIRGRGQEVYGRETKARA